MGSAIVGPSRRMYSRNFVLTSPTSLACWRSRSDTFSSMAAVMVTVVRSGGCLLLCLRRLFESLNEEGSWRFFFELLRSAASASWRFLRSSSCPATSCPSCASIFSCCVSCFSNAAMIRLQGGNWHLDRPAAATNAAHGEAWNGSAEEGTCKRGATGVTALAR